MHLDIAVLDLIQHYMHNPALDFIMPLITRLGDYGIFWLALAVVLAISKKYRWLGLTIILAIFFSYLVCNVLLKTIIARVRPCELNTAVQLLLPCPASSSFPSGHSAVSFAVATVLAVNRFSCWPLFLLLAALVGFSRLYLYVHFPSDVLAGAVVGAAAGLAAYYMMKRFYRPYAGQRGT